MDGFERFRLDIELGDDAMSTPEHVATALVTVARQVVDGREEGAIKDANGNRVGSWTFES